MKSYTKFLNEITLNPPEVIEGMQGVCEYALSQDTVGDVSGVRPLRDMERRDLRAEMTKRCFSDHAMYQLASKINWSSHAAMVTRWFQEGIPIIGEHPEINLLIINLGDSPEVFYSMGVPLKGGQEAADQILSQLTEDVWTWLDGCGNLLWDDSVELAYHRTDELPGPIRMMEALAISYGNV